MTDPDRGSREFEIELDIAASRDAVWDAISKDTELMRWFAPVASADAKVGGEIVWEWGRHHRWPQRIEILEPGARLRTRYDSRVDDGEGGKKPLFVDFFLEGEGGVTTLRLVQSGFGPEADFDEEYDGISRGWPVELRSLRLYLESHAGKDRRLAWSTLELAIDPDEAWRRLAGPDGFGCGPAAASLREGEAFEFTTADGDTFSGTALACQAREFTGDARSHGGAFLRISVEVWGGLTHLWCWLGAYDRAAGDVAALAGRWDTMLARLFATQPESATRGEG